MANLPTVNEMGKEIIYFIFQTGPLDNLHAGEIPYLSKGDEPGIGEGTRSDLNHMISGSDCYL